MFEIVWPYRADLSGRPFGFLLMWRPDHSSPPHMYAPVKCAWSVGAYWYPQWKHAIKVPLLPRIKFAVGHPAQ